MSSPIESEKSEVPLRSDEAQVSAAVKAWLKIGLVPAMVKQYIAAHSVASETVSDDPAPE
jgi:hypothetical protein